MIIIIIIIITIIIISVSISIMIIVKGGMYYIHHHPSATVILTNLLGLEWTRSTLPRLTLTPSFPIPSPSLFPLP